MSSLILDIIINNRNEYVQKPGYAIEYTTSTKFRNDKIDYQNDDYYILLEGIVLNKEQLINERTQLDWSETLIELYKETGSQFIARLKGSYYGFLLDKKESKWIVFSDHIGSKPIYYVKYKNHICFANNYTELVNYLRQNKEIVTFNEQAAYLLLSYGFVFEDITITNEIKRLMIGHSAIIHNGVLQFNKFYSLTNNPVEISEEGAIEEVDKLFRQTVQRAFEKDREYGYEHVATLSGGLDSRMTVWVAHDLGYTDQLNITFSQSNYLDETIAKQIAADLKHEWLFKALDNGNFLYDLDQTTHISGGNLLYSGLAHSMSLNNYLNFENLGILHTGQLGDVVLGTYASSKTYNSFKMGDGAFSSVMLHAISQFKIKEEYPNEEIFKMYFRGFYGINQGLLGIQKYTESYSPFYDVDFMEFALSIPLKLRFNHYLYKKWIIKKYPEASKYIWEKEKVPVNYSYNVNIMGKNVPLSQIPNRIFAKLGYNKYGLNTKNHMNPLEYWYRTNRHLKNFMDKYYHKNIHLLDDFPQLKTDCEKLYFNTNGTEKIQVLSLLGCIHYLKENRN